MSEIMLLGVLRMPPECWSGDTLDVMQRHSRYLEAADEIEALKHDIDRHIAIASEHATENARLREALSFYADIRNHNGDRNTGHVPICDDDYLGDKARAVLGGCDHEWIDIRNRSVESGEMCRKCNAVRAGNQTSPPPEPVAQSKSQQKRFDAMKKADQTNPALDEMVRASEDAGAYDLPQTGESR